MKVKRNRWKQILIKTTLIHIMKNIISKINSKNFKRWTIINKNLKKES